MTFSLQGENTNNLQFRDQADETFQQLSTLVALPDDLNLVPSTHVAAKSYL